MSSVVRGRPLVRGAAEGRLLFTNQPLSMWGGLDPLTGRIIDSRHELCGCCVTGTILALPRGKGSSTASAVLLDAIRRRTAPAAILTSGVDLILTLGAVVADEMWGDVLPIVILPEAVFATLPAYSHAAVSPDGGVRLE